MTQRDNRILIKKMKQENIKELTSIEKLCFSTPWSSHGLTAELNNPHSHFIVALKEDTAIGYVGMHYYEDTSSITNIAVHPNHRNQGIASNLLTNLFTFAKENNIKEISLEVRVSNTKAINLYKNHGFKEAATRKNLYTHPTEDGIVMIKTL